MPVFRHRVTEKMPINKLKRDPVEGIPFCVYEYGSYVDGVVNRQHPRRCQVVQHNHNDEHQQLWQVGRYIHQRYFLLLRRR